MSDYAMTLSIHLSLSANLSDYLKLVSEALTHLDEDKWPQFFRWPFQENAWISIKISLKFVPEGRINYSNIVSDNGSWPGGKPLSEPVMIRLLTHICMLRLIEVMTNLTDDIFLIRSLGVRIASLKSFTVGICSDSTANWWFIWMTWSCHQLALNDPSYMSQ